MSILTAPLRACVARAEDAKARRTTRGLHTKLLTTPALAPHADGQGRKHSCMMAMPISLAFRGAAVAPSCSTPRHAAAAKGRTMALLPKKLVVLTAAAAAPSFAAPRRTSLVRGAGGNTRLVLTAASSSPSSAPSGGSGDEDADADAGADADADDEAAGRFSMTGDFQGTDEAGVQPAVTPEQREYTGELRNAGPPYTSRLHSLRPARAPPSAAAVSPL